MLEDVPSANRNRDRIFIRVLRVISATSGVVAC